ncbi:S1C family serine protease [Paenibacillus caseinilyticus]|nr:trypsin-like peptidase domain-containing protein [Paenibacillus mucilaginosus]
MKLKRNRIIGCAAMLSLVLGAGGAVAQGGQAQPVTWAAAQMNGELYVKASDVVRTLGGDGTFLADANRFSYIAPSAVPDAVKKVSPATVGIIGKPIGNSSSSDNRYNLAHGTGVIVQSNGLIITNAHVVKEMSQLIVVTADGKQYKGTTTHIDEESDLALVKIEAEGLPTAEFAKSSELVVGETVVAIGTPISFALRNSVSVGVVSGMDRSLHSTYRLIQTDAAINPGNSGGALVNLKGEIIGINSLKLSAAGVDGLGFAIPSDTVQYVLKHFLTYGYVKHPGLGLDVEESWAAIVGLPTDEPLRVSRIHPGTSAASAGIKEGDVLYSIGDKNLKSIVDLNEYLKQYLPGDKITLTLQSGGDLVQKEITLVEIKTN